MIRRLFIVMGVIVGFSGGWFVARLQYHKPDSVQSDIKPDTQHVDAEPPALPDNPLSTLDWLVGDWVDDSENVNINFHCHWTKNSSFLVRSFTMQKADNVRLNGMQLIAWDAANETIRSWTYDAEGGFGEETWTQSGNRYTIRSKYTLPDGGSGSSIQVMTFIDHNTFQWQSVNRELDGTFQPDTAVITLVRKADATTKEGAN